MSAGWRTVPAVAFPNPGIGARYPQSFASLAFVSPYVPSPPEGARPLEHILWLAASWPP